MKRGSWLALSILSALATLSAGCGGFTDIELAPKALPSGVVGVVYSAELNATGGAGRPWTWNIEGDLPPGLAFIGGHEEVYIRGTPTTPGTYSIKVVVSDLYQIKDHTYSIVVTGTAGNPLTIVTAGLPNGSAGQTYAANVTAQGGSGTGYAWLVESGSLPPGLSLIAGTPSATISGTPPVPGGYVFTLRVTDSQAATTTRGFSISVGDTISISTQLPFPQAIIGVAYSASLTANGGTGSGHVWSVSQGILPSGLSLGATGSPSTTISGTPTTVGNFQFTVMVVDSGSNAGVLGFNIDVLGSLTITTTTLPAAQVGSSYVQSVNSAGGSGGPYTWSIVSGALPPGLSIGGTTATGTISGLPTSAGTFNFTVQVQDAGGTDTQALSIVVIATGPITIGTTTTLPSAEPGIAYGATITASGGTSAGYTWSIIGGTLPPGLTLGSSGTPSTTISGNASGAGDYVFDVRVLDSGSNSSVKQFTLHVFQASEWLTVTGNGTSGVSGDGGVSYTARVNGPRGCFVDAAGHLYFCDTLNHKVRRIDAVTRVITTVAGTGIGGFTADGIAAVSSALNQPNGVWVDATGNLFIADSSNNRVRRVDAGTGLISTVAGTGGAGFAGDGGLATSALLNFPIHVAVSPAGDIFICDYDNFRVRRVSVSTGIITTFAGNGLLQHSGDGGPATAASFHYASSVGFDSAGGVLISETYYYIRRVDGSGTITTIAGITGGGIGGDGGPASAARFTYVSCISLDSADNVYVLDGSRVRRIDGTSGTIDDIGTLQAALAFGGGIAVGPGGGKVYVTDPSNHRIRLRIP